jgi:hypothetical protein
VTKIRYYSNFAMVAIYIALGLLFLFTDIGIDSFPAYRKEIGWVMLIYAVIRVALSIRKFKREE